MPYEQVFYRPGISSPQLLHPSTFLRANISILVCEGNISSILSRTSSGFSEWALRLLWTI